MIPEPEPLSRRIARFCAWGLIAITAAVVLLSVAASIARAQTQLQVRSVPCASTEALLSELASVYKEQPAYQAASGADGVMLTIAPNGSWSLLRLSDGGTTACLVETGQRWRAVPVKAGDPS